MAKNVVAWVLIGTGVIHIEALHADQRESRDREEALVLKLDAAEAKLAALVKAATAVCEWDPARLEGNLYAEGLVADLGSLRNATKAARGFGDEWRGSEAALAETLAKAKR